MDVDDFDETKQRLLPVDEIEEDVRSGRIPKDMFISFYEIIVGQVGVEEAQKTDVGLVYHKLFSN